MNTNGIKAMVKDALATGADPNTVQGKVEGAVEDVVREWAKAHGWSLWGDGEWREDTACSICGSDLPGACGHEKDPAMKVLCGLEAVAAYKRFADAKAKVS